MHRLISYVALAFTVSWSIAISCWFAAGRSNPAIAPLLPVAMMVGPALAAIICALAFDSRRRVTALGLGLRPNWWWSLSYVVGLALPAIAVAATIALLALHQRDGVIARTPLR